MKHLLTLLLACICITAHAGETPRVLVTIKPLHSIVSQLLNGISEPELLLQGYQSPHTFQLRPSDARKLNDSDVIIWVGPTMETGLLKTLRRMTRQTVIQLNEAHHGHAADDLHADPHRWLDPHLTGQDAGHIARLFAERYPDHARQIDINYQQLAGKLRQLDQDIAKALPAGSMVSALLYHDAWKYFQDRYGITTHGIINPSAHGQPGARHLYEIGQVIEQQHTQCLLVEPQFKPRYLKSLQEKYDLRLVTLDPLAAELPAGPDNYFQMMKNITSAFAQCLPAKK
jgi:zinc transport system substrate-binding protein